MLPTSTKPYSFLPMILPALSQAQWLALLPSPVNGQLHLWSAHLLPPWMHTSVNNPSGNPTLITSPSATNHCPANQLTHYERFEAGQSFAVLSHSLDFTKLCLMTKCRSASQACPMTFLVARLWILSAVLALIGLALAGMVWGAEMA